MGGSPSVCIVGAGMAGLRCAELLIKNGLQVTVFEGRDRIGGRCHQSSFLGPNLDLGCNQIHGTDHNPFMGLAKETNTSTYLPEDVHSIFLKDGEKLQGKEALSVWTAVEDLLATGVSFSRTHSANISQDTSLWDWFSAQVDEMGTTQQQKDRMLQVVRDWGGYSGEDIATQSFKNLWMETNMPGDNLVVASTYSKILEKVAAATLEHAELHLSEEVVRIENLGKESKDAGKILIETANGLRKTCDQVVVTTPLGWLQRNKQAFVPSMPQKLTDAIDSVSYSRLEKAFVRFPNAWWEGNQDGFGDREKFASATLFTTPEYAPDTNPGRWNQEIFSYSALPSDLSHPTLLFYIYGDNSKLITEALQNIPKESPKYQDILAKFFAPYYSLLPNYNKSNPDCAPERSLITDWEHDKFAGYGAYSHYAVPLQEGAKVVEIIRNGMSADRNIWFAGEHTAPEIALSTIVGAYWSGERVAREIQHHNGGCRGKPDIMQDFVAPELSSNLEL